MRHTTWHDERSAATTRLLAEAVAHEQHGCVAQRRGARVTVISTFRSSPPMVADELRRQADNFIELDDLRDQIAREPRPNQNHDHPDSGYEDDFEETA